MAGVVTECTSQNAFDQALQQAGTTQLVVVDFTASWCGPCKMIKPHFEALAKQYTNVKFLKVDVDTNRATSQAYGVSAMPTFLFIKNKAVLETIRGADRNKLTAAVEKHSKGSTGSSSAFAGKGNTLSGGSRYNPLGDDEEDDDDDGQYGAREEGEEREGDLDPQVRAFLERQHASQPHDVESMRLREERIKAGGMRNVKSRYQREKEEAQRKKEQAEREAAEAYDEFVRAMDGGGGGGSSSLSSAQAGKDRRAAMGFVSAGGTSSYNPARPPPPPAAPKAMRTPAPSSTSALGGMFGADDDDEDGTHDTHARREPPGKRKRAVDDFVGELQKQQAQREERYKDRIAEGTSVSSILALQGQKMGSRDAGDPQTTNVCVLNLPANISEKTLGEFFSQWGDIGTVKIMWPRSDESTNAAARNTRTAGFTGFVCFMKRFDAESAFREADGISWGGVLLKTSWGKAMPKPPRALYVMPHSSRRDRETQEEPFTRGRSSSPPRRRNRPSRKVNEHRHQRSPSPRTHVFTSLSPEQVQTVSTVAERIKAYGPSFEQMVREKEAGNAKFAFLDSESQSNEAHYFRALLDDRYVPALPEQPFCDEGYASLYESDSGEDSETDRLKKQRKTDTLGRLARKRLESMLRSLTLRRERIMRCTAFAIEHANASDAIADLLTTSLLQPTTPIPRKLARLYVISDILHNSAVPLPNAWKYRSAFEAHGRIVVIFQHFAQIAKSFPGIMKQESVKGHLRALLDVWDDWMVFAPGLVEQLRRMVESGGRAVVGESAAANDVGETVVGKQPEPAAAVDDDIDGEDIDGEDIDGEDMV